VDVFADSSSLSAPQAARALGVSLGTIRCWSDLGYLQSYRNQAGQLRFSRDALETFAETIDRRQVGVLAVREAL
jgi:excisionase family DNA binding protein